MLFSFGLVLLTGTALGALAVRLKLPRLCGILLTGLLLGPYCFDLLDAELLNASADLRRLALIVILIKAGLSLDLPALRRVGRPAVLMSFLPASFEILAWTLFAPPLLGLSRVEGALIGSILGAVSPAVVVPGMLGLIERRLGVQKGIPQLILAGSSLDDIFVLVIFTAVSGMAQGGALNPVDFVQAPVSILTGLAAGTLLGFFFHQLFLSVHMRDSVKVILLLGAAAVVSSMENMVPFPFSGLLTVLGCGAVLAARRKNVAARLSDKFSKLWIAAEILLFVLVGAAVNLQYASHTGFGVIVMLLLGLLIRSIGTLLCLTGSAFSAKERLFCVISYLPKATVQAAIGALPLAMGLPCGELALTAAVASILITAPLGALAIERTGPLLLSAPGERSAAADKAG